MIVNPKLDFCPMNKNIITSRHSVFPAAFVEGSLTKETILELLEYANHAPTHRLTEPWRFKVVEGSRLGDFAALAEKSFIQTAGEGYSEVKLQKTLGKINKAAAIVIISMRRDTEARVPEWEELAATAMAVQNLWLALDSYGLGGYWSTPSWAVSDYFAEKTGLEESEKPLGIFYIGFVNKNIPADARKRSPIEEKVGWF